MSRARISRGRRARGAAVVLAVAAMAVLGLSPVAEAQDFAAAGQHFSAAQAAFAKQQFHAAAREFQAAYQITKDPVLLYNIGESYQKAGMGKEAVASYRAYLTDAPHAQDRGDVERRIQTISAKNFQLPDQSQAAATAAPPAPLPPPPAPTANEPPHALVQPAPVPAPTPESVKPAPVPPPHVAEAAPVGLDEEPHPSTMRVTAWIGVASTVALLTTGAIFGLAAQSRADEISRRFIYVDSSGQPAKFDQSAQADYQSLKDDGHLYNGLAIGFYSAAAASAVATTVLFIVDARRAHAHHSVEVTPVVGPGHAGVSAGWSF